MTKVVTYIEIDIPFCANTYGVAPCTASLTSSPPTGIRKCFNTPNTCQDRVNYIDAPVTLRFTKDVGFANFDIDAIPSILNISYTPAVVSLGKDLGTRASLSVTFKDHPWSDIGQGFDKYRSERPYDPYKQGTFWGKFRARQPFLHGRAMRMIRGEVGQALVDMETRHYHIDSFTHDAASGTYTITAKDLLKFADDDRSQAPRLSQGFLVADITASAGIYVTLSPSGIANEDGYPESGHLAIGGKETVTFVRDRTAGNDSHAKLLAHLDVSPLVDSSSSAKTISISGSVVIASSQAVFNGGHIFLSDSPDWTQAGDFTIETRVRIGSLAALQTIFQHATDANNRYALEINTNGSLTFKIISASVTILTMTSAAGTVVALGAGYYHTVVMRTGNVWEIAVDGIRVATVTQATVIPNFTSLFRIGANQAGGAQMSNGSSMYEFRFSDIARFVTPFEKPNPSVLYQTSSDILYLSQRGQLGSEALSHSAQDRVQVILNYSGEDAADIIYDLFVNYAGIDPSYIPLETWQTETANFLSRVFSADIAEPVGVNKLVSELIDDAALSIWWDDVSEQIKLRVLRPVAPDSSIFDQDVYLEGSFKSQEQPNERLSQVWRYFAKRNPLEPQDNEDNYRSVAVAVDLEAETDYGSSAIRKLFSRWTPFGGRSIADKANTLYLSRFRDPPRKFNFSTFRTSSLTPSLGQGFFVGGQGLQNDIGEFAFAPIQITRLNPSDAQFDIEAQEMALSGDAVDLINRIIVIDSNVNNVNLETLHNTLYPEATDQDVIDGVNLTLYIDAGVTVASILSFGSLSSLIVGDWPVGFPITVVVNGKLLGHGGIGASSGIAGGPGGTALYTRHPIILEYTGIIRAGGGGGGAGATKFTSSSGGRYWVGCGGGGGAGTPPGTGGTGTTNGDTGYVPPKGAAGTETTGGAGGNGGSSLTNPGGNGGAPGVAGSNGSSSNGGPTTVISATAGGAAGKAIDGISFVTITVSTGTLTGPTVN